MSNFSYHLAAENIDDRKGNIAGDILFLECFISFIGRFINFYLVLVIFSIKKMLI